MHFFFLSPLYLRVFNISIVLPGGDVPCIVLVFVLLFTSVNLSHLFVLWWRDNFSEVSQKSTQILLCQNIWRLPNNAGLLKTICLLTQLVTAKKGQIWIIIFFFYVCPLSYRSSSKCEWTEQQPHLWCLKFEKHILLFSTLKGLVAGWPIHQNVSKKVFWWNFKVKEAMWLGKWCTETKKNIVQLMFQCLRV